MKKTLLSVVSISAFISAITASSSIASPTLWSLENTANKGTSNSAVKKLTLDQQALDALLRNTPKENTTSQGFEINVPLPNGELVTLELVEYSMMEPALAEKFPEIKTYKAFGVNDSSITGRFDYTSTGLRGIVSKAGETYYFDPSNDKANSNYQTYARSAYKAEKGDTKGFTCTVKHAPDFLDNTIASRSSAVNTTGTANKIYGEKLHTYRIAVAANGEYTQFHGGTVDSGQTAIVTAINRINEIFGREMSVKFSLIGNNDQLVYTNSSTDPYSNNDGYAMLEENKDTLNSIIGSANYDIGHVFSTGGGGIAQLRAPCSTGKAEGVTGSPSPTNDTFWVDYVAHEIGHQMGANHTFNGDQGFCSGNRETTASYEPGSGSTIMSYAGICGSDNIVSNSNDYFHAKSLDEVDSFLSSAGNSCGTHITQSNQAPTAEAGGNYTIPQQTPFELTASGSDADSDALTYNWEEYDLGPASAPGIDNGFSPIFRSFSPSTNPIRTFPLLSTLISNSAPPNGSVLPYTDRTLNFRLTVRDGNGAVTSDDSQITVTTGSGPFDVTSQPGATTWTGNSIETVTWNVAGTTNAPVNCTTVDILFSTDNATSFPITALSNTANDGSESITVPNFTTAQGRIKVKCSENIFFDINQGSINNTSIGTAPVIQSMSFSITAGLSITSPIPATDAEDDELTFTIMTPPTKGTLSILNGSYTYTANVGENGSDTFVIKANDGLNDSLNATATINIAAASTTVVTGPDPTSGNYQAEITSQSATTISWQSDNTIQALSPTVDGLTTHTITSDNMSVVFSDTDSLALSLAQSASSASCIAITINGLTIEADSLALTDEIRTAVLSDTRIQIQRTNGCDLQINVADGSNSAKPVTQLPQLSGSTASPLNVTISEIGNVFTVSIEGQVPADGITF